MEYSESDIPGSRSEQSIQKMDTLDDVIKGILTYMHAMLWRKLSFLYVRRCMRAPPAEVHKMIHQQHFQANQYYVAVNEIKFPFHPTFVSASRPVFWVWQ